VYALRVGGALRAPRRQSLLRSQARCALLPAATPRLTYVGLASSTAFAAQRVRGRPPWTP